VRLTEREDGTASFMDDVRMPSSDPGLIPKIQPCARCLLARNNYRNLSASGSNCSGHHRDTFSAAIEWHFGSSK